MRFTKLIAGATLALSATQTQALLSPGEIAETFEQLTDTASDIIQTVASLDPGRIIFSIPRIAGQLGQIVEGVAQAATSLGNPDKYKDLGRSDSDKICDALENFVDKARDAVDSIIGKNSIIGRTPFVGIVAEILSVAADGLEALARSAVKIVPGCKDRIEKKLTILNGSFHRGIIYYRKVAQQGIDSIPTPTPAVLPLPPVLPPLPPVITGIPTSQVTDEPIAVPFRA